MTRVSDQAKRCGTAESIPVQSVSATCPVSHFFFLEKELSAMATMAEGGGCPGSWGIYTERRGTRGTRDSSAQHPPQLLLNQLREPLLCGVQQQAVEVDLGVDLGLLIHKGEGQAHSVLDPVAAPDSRTEAGVFVRDHELTLRPCRVR